MAWMWFDATPSTYEIIFYHATSSYSNGLFWFHDADGSVSVTNSNNNFAILANTTPIPEDTWVFLCTSVDATNGINLYWRFEGEASLSTDTGSWVGTFSNNLMGWAGITVVGETNTLLGRIAYARLFSGVLNATQILAESASAAPVGSAWGSWAFASTSNDTADGSGNNRSLTRAGSGSYSSVADPNISIEEEDEVFGELLLDGGGSFGMQGSKSKSTTIILPGGGSLDLTGTKAKSGTASLDAGGELILDGSKSKSGTGLLDGGGDFTLDGVKAKSGTGLLDGGGDFTIDGTRSKSGTGLLDGGGDFELDGTRKASGVAALLGGGGTFTLDGSKSKSGSGLLDGGGEFELTGATPQPVDISVEISASRNRDAFAVAASRLRPTATPAASRTRPLFAAAASRGGAFDVDGSRTKWSVGPSRIDRT
jgi:hypothetical protein